MKSTWRWFGPKDPISLAHIKQAGATGIVTALHEVPAGEVWTQEAINERKAIIEAAGLEWTVIESIPMHNDIKSRTGNYEALIENYKTSIKNAAACGIKTICYNFMPVVDWTRTDLEWELPNGARALRFEMTDFIAYDVFILERENARNDYTDAQLEIAKARFEAMNHLEKELLEKNIIAGLPGGEGSYTRASIKEAIAQYVALGVEGLRKNLYAFLQAIIPVAESVGARMCIHPDDPPFSLFGLPRVVSTAEDVRGLLAAAPSPANGITFCVGSYGVRLDNDVPAMAREFADKIYFAHLRNVKTEADGSFFEDDHLAGNVNMYQVITAILGEEKRRAANGHVQLDIPFRPDHGHLMADEIGRAKVNPGYSYIGRLKGLGELHGVIYAAKQMND